MFDMLVTNDMGGGLKLKFGAILGRETAI